jgi:hypothetical protein
VLQRFGRRRCHTCIAAVVGLRKHFAELEAAAVSAAVAEKRRWQSPPLLSSGSSADDAPLEMRQRA